MRRVIKDAGACLKPIRGNVTRVSCPGHTKEYVEEPGTSAATVRTPRAHLHHAGSAGAGTGTTPNPQERETPGVIMGDYTDISLPDMQHLT